MRIPVEVSARHAHLTGEQVEVLFGKGSKLTVLRNLSQPGQFAANETVALVGPKGCLENVRIIGPVRSAFQAEVSKTEARSLGIDPPYHISGDLGHTPGVTVRGPAGEFKADCGVIISLRHLHLDPKTAEEWGLKDGSEVSVRVDGERGLVFDRVHVRVNRDYKPSFQIDTDEANAAGIGNEPVFGEILL